MGDLVEELPHAPPPGGKFLKKPNSHFLGPMSGGPRQVKYGVLRIKRFTLIEMARTNKAVRFYEGPLAKAIADFAREHARAS